MLIASAGDSQHRPGCAATGGATRSRQLSRSRRTIVQRLRASAVVAADFGVGEEHLEGRAVDHMGPAFRALGVTDGDDAGEVERYLYAAAVARRAAGRLTPDGMGQVGHGVLILGFRRGGGGGCGWWWG